MPENCITVEIYKPFMCLIIALRPKVYSCSFMCLTQKLKTEPLCLPKVSTFPLYLTFMLQRTTGGYALPHNTPFRPCLRPRGNDRLEAATGEFAISNRNQASTLRALCAISVAAAVFRRVARSNRQCALLRVRTLLPH